MLKTFYLLLTLLLFSVSSFSQTEVTWKVLKVDSFVEGEWKDEFQANIKIPIFSERLQELDGKTILVKGFILAIAPDYPVQFLVNSTTMSGGPCTSFPGTQSPLQLDLESYKGSLEDEVMVKGKLKLNKDDLMKMNLILEDAEIVK